MLLNKTYQDIAIVIPIAEAEDAWPYLLQDLANTQANEANLYLVGTQKTIAALDLREFKKLFRKIELLVSKRGRASQMNRGAKISGEEFLWFLHADSRIEEESVDRLLDAVNRCPEALHYFDLEFLHDGPGMVYLNALGAYLRSKILGIPFGDQGFCISRENFFDLGQFPEHEKYGEDHLLVWRAKRKGLPIQSTNTFIKTSARKYQERGWMNTTLLHWNIWPRQALPQMLKLIKENWIPRF